MDQVGYKLREGDEPIARLTKTVVDQAQTILHLGKAVKGLSSEVISLQLVIKVLREKLEAEKVARKCDRSIDVDNNRTQLILNTVTRAPKRPRVSDNDIDRNNDEEDDEALQAILRDIDNEQSNRGQGSSYSPAEDEILRKVLGPRCVTTSRRAARDSSARSGDESGAKKPRTVVGKKIWGMLADKLGRSMKSLQHRWVRLRELDAVREAGVWETTVAAATSSAAAATGLTSYAANPSAKKTGKTRKATGKTKKAGKAAVGKDKVVGNMSTAIMEQLAGAAAARATGERDIDSSESSSSSDSESESEGKGGAECII